MRAALIFPPQWDPRQPPLGIPVLAGVLGHAGAEVRVFDLNLSLYRKLIRPSIPGGIEDVLLAQLLDENLLQDAEQYLRVTGEIQKIFDTRFDPRGSFRLFWDTCAGPLSPGISGHWRRAFADPAGLPFLDRIAPEIAEKVGMFLQHGDIQSGAGEQQSGHHPGGATPHNHNIAVIVHDLLSPLCNLLTNSIDRV